MKKTDLQGRHTLPVAADHDVCCLQQADALGKNSYGSDHPSPVFA